jgi:hypothetical protein
MAVTTGSVVLWDMTPCSPVDVHQCFGGTYCLHLQGKIVSQVSRKQLACGAYGTPCIKALIASVPQIILSKIIVPSKLLCLREVCFYSYVHFNIILTINGRSYF